jgi:hypothetical protein
MIPAAATRKNQVMRKNQTDKPKKTNRRAQGTDEFAEPRKVPALDHQRRSAASTLSYAVAVAHLEIAEALFAMLSCDHPNMQCQRAFVHFDDISEAPIPHAIYTCADCGFNSDSACRYHPVHMNRLIADKLQRLGHRTEPSFVGVKRYVALVDSDIAAAKEREAAKDNSKTTE